MWPWPSCVAAIRRKCPHLCLNQGDHLERILTCFPRAWRMPSEVSTRPLSLLPLILAPHSTHSSPPSLTPHSTGASPPSLTSPPHYITPAPLTAANPGPQLTPPFSGRACALPLFCDVTLTIDISAGRRAAAHCTALHHSLNSLTTQSSSLGHCLLATGEAGRLISWSGRAGTSF